MLIFFLVVLQPSSGYGVLINEVSRLHTMTHHSWWDSSGWVISLSHRPLPGNIQHSQDTDIHCPSGIRTQSLSRQAATDLHLRPHSHWDWHGPPLPVRSHLTFPQWVKNNYKLLGLHQVNVTLCVITLHSAEMFWHCRETYCLDQFGQPEGGGCMFLWDIWTLINTWCKNPEGTVHTFTAGTIRILAGW